VSVDAVVFPATTKSFHEQHQPGEGLSLAESLSRLGEERSLLERHIARLRTELAELQTHRDVEVLLDEARLPPSTLTDVFRGQLRAAPNAEARKMLLEERRLLIESLSRVSQMPTSQERQGDPLRFPQGPTDDQLLAALKRR
jgi:hypothetical protein